jgi:MinD superfamily P-loop ATPase
MMQVDLKKCTGCGECLEVCAVDAISLVQGRAVIDPDTCLVCEACAQACPQGAISGSRMPVPVMEDFHPEPAYSMVTSSQSESRLAWAAPVLSYVSREILPRVVDSLIVALDRRLSSPTEVQVDSSRLTVASGKGSRRQVRRRRRCRRLE